MTESIQNLFKHQNVLTYSMYLSGKYAVAVFEILCITLSSQEEVLHQISKVTIVVDLAPPWLHNLTPHRVGNQVAFFLRKAFSKRENF
jgi:hypothetical protein